MQIWNHYMREEIKATVMKREQVINVNISGMNFKNQFYYFFKIILIKDEKIDACS